MLSKGIWSNIFSFFTKIIILFSKLLAIPFMLILFGLLFNAARTGGDHVVWIMVFVMICVLIYIFSPQLDWWWYQKYPPKLDPMFKALLEKHFTFYKNLSEENKEKFRIRVAMYMEGNEILSKGPEDMGESPDDLQGFVAAQIVHLTFGREDYKMDMFERIILYPGSFPSPQFPKRFHASEIFQEDGVMLLSARQLVNSVLKPEEHYNIGLHEYGKVFQLVYPDYNYPTNEQLLWSDLEKISGFSQKKAEDQYGLPLTDTLNVGITFFFIFPEKFKAILPEIYARFVEIFEADPILLKAENNAATEA